LKEEIEGNEPEHEDSVPLKLAADCKKKICLDGSIGRMVYRAGVIDISGRDHGTAYQGLRGIPLTIVDRGYFWMQLAPKDKKYWLTVMLDAAGDIVSYYFDITDSNVLSGDGDSYFYDLYLDVVLLSSVKDSLIELAMVTNPHKQKRMLERLSKRLIASTVPIRPGRSFVRIRKHKAHKFPSNRTDI
jgi:hypothetical protein